MAQKWPVVMSTTEIGSLVKNATALIVNSLKSLPTSLSVWWYYMALYSLYGINNNTWEQPIPTTDQRINLNHNNISLINLQLPSTRHCYCCSNHSFFSHSLMVCVGIWIGYTCVCIFLSINDNAWWCLPAGITTPWALALPQRPIIRGSCGDWRNRQQVVFTASEKSGRDCLTRD